MSEEPTVSDQQDAPVSKATRPPNPTVQLVGVVAAAILAFALLVWAQGVRTAAVKREAFGRGVDGISAALAIPVIETGSRVNPNRGARLQSIVESIQRTGTYQSVIVTDANGNVLASTDTGVQGQTLKDMVEVKSPAIMTETDGLVEATCSILMDGGNKVGALRIKAKL